MRQQTVAVPYGLTGLRTVGVRVPDARQDPLLLQMPSQRHSAFQFRRRRDPADPFTVPKPFGQRLRCRLDDIFRILSSGLGGGQERSLQMQTRELRFVFFSLSLLSSFCL